MKLVFVALLRLPRRLRALSHPPTKISGHFRYHLPELEPKEGEDQDVKEQRDAAAGEEGEQVEGQGVSGQEDEQHERLLVHPWVEVFVLHLFFFQQGRCVGRARMNDGSHGDAP